MIRDPSDGTVKQKPVMGTATSGLPIDKLKADEIQRLERARTWLKDYFQRKPEGGTDAQIETDSDDPGQERQA